MTFTALAATLLILAGSIQTPCTVTELKSPASEDYLWEILQEEAPNDYVAAGILGYFWRESFYRSDAVAHWMDHEEGYCEDFTRKLDEADREEFVELVQASGGYGLGQWYAESHLESLYDFCKGCGTSFADAGMQCRFTVHMCVSDPDVWETLQNAGSALEAGKIVGHLHDGSDTGSETIAAKAAMIYKERISNHEHNHTDGNLPVHHHEPSGADADHAEESAPLSETGRASAGRTDPGAESRRVPG